MGWYYEDKPSGQTISEFFDKKVTFERNGYKSRMLDCAVVGPNTAYMAVERSTSETEKSEVYAIVCHLHRLHNDYPNFGYKDEDEDLGPTEFRCPERILKLLTPATTENAKHWREVCWKEIEKQEKAPPLNLRFNPAGR